MAGRAASMPTESTRRLVSESSTVVVQLDLRESTLVKIAELWVSNLSSAQGGRAEHVRGAFLGSPSVVVAGWARWLLVLVRLAYLAVGNAFAMARLLPVGEREKDVEILVLRHQITVLERQLGAVRVRFAPEDRVLLAALLAWLPRRRLSVLQLLVRPDTILRWHRDPTRRQHAALSRRKGPGRPL